MRWSLEIVVVPVADVDRARRFYADSLGFTVDHDTTVGGARAVQLTPPGSACSIVIGRGEAPPGSVTGLQLVVPDVTRARAELLARGVAVSDVQVLGPAAPDAAHPLDDVGFVFFTDPDGNGWAVQQVAAAA